MNFTLDILSEISGLEERDEKLKTEIAKMSKKWQQMDNRGISSFLVCE